MAHPPGGPRPTYTTSRDANNEARAGRRSSGRWPDSSDLVGQLERFRTRLGGTHIATDRLRNASNFGTVNAA